MDRREFLAGLASSVLAAGHLPLLAGGRTALKSLAATGGLDYPFDPIKGYVKKNRPLAEGAISGEQYTLKYAILLAAGSPVAPAMRNPTVGTLTISRSLGQDGAPRYEVQQMMTGRPVDRRVTSRITCRDNELNTPVSWSTHTRQPSRGKVTSQSREEGRIEGDEVILRGPCDTIYRAERPVACWWTLLDFLARRADRDTRVEFDMLREMSRFHPGQTMRYDGTVTLPRSGDRGIKLHNFVQRGHAVPAANFLLDENGLPQLVTGLQVSWALQSVRA